MFKYIPLFLVLITNIYSMQLTREGSPSLVGARLVQPMLLDLDDQKIRVSLPGKPSCGLSSGAVYTKSAENGTNYTAISSYNPFYPKNTQELITAFGFSDEDEIRPLAQLPSWADSGVEIVDRDGAGQITLICRLFTTSKRPIALLISGRDIAYIDTFTSSVRIH